MAPPSSTGTGTMRAGGACSQLPAEHARHHSPDPLRHAGNAVFELWVMHGPLAGEWRAALGHPDTVEIALVFMSTHKLS